MAKSGGPEIDVQKLRAWLQEKGWTVTRLGQETGVSYSHIHHIAEGVTKPGRKFLMGLVALGVDIRTLVREDDAPAPTDTAAV